MASKFNIKDQLAGVAALIAAIVAIGGGFAKYGELNERINTLTEASKKIDKVSSVPEGAVPSNIMQKIQAKEVPESLLGRTSEPQEENLLGRTE